MFYELVAKDWWSLLTDEPRVFILPSTACKSYKTHLLCGYSWCNLFSSLKNESAHRKPSGQITMKCFFTVSIPLLLQGDLWTPDSDMTKVSTDFPFNSLASFCCPLCPSRLTTVPLFMHQNTILQENVNLSSVCQHAHFKNMCLASLISVGSAVWTNTIQNQYWQVHFFFQVWEENTTSDIYNKKTDSLSSLRTKPGVLHFPALMLLYVVLRNKTRGNYNGAVILQTDTSYHSPFSHMLQGYKLHLFSFLIYMGLRKTTVF